MAKKKFYAVRKGRETGLFDSWEVCKPSVTGYPGAEFRGFSTEEEANAWLLDVQDVESEPESGEAAENPLIAYVDGSYDESIGRYAYGCILLTPEGEIVKESGSENNPEALAIRNVAGEMLGAVNAVKWAAKNGYQSIELRYDYEGIEKWVTGGWKTKNELTQKYAEFMKGQQAVLSIRFRKVRAHTGDYYNEEADKLAKHALNSYKFMAEKGEKKLGENDFSQDLRKKKQDM